LLFLGLLLSACSGPRTTIQAKLPYKKLIQNAEVETRAGNYLAAADNYRKAYDQKPRKKEVLYQAATLYTRARDYKKAANTYQFLEADEQRWPLLGLQYGRALKQDGRYEQTRRQLALFREAYNGADRAIVTEIVNNELAGIRLAEAGTAERTDGCAGKCGCLAVCGVCGNNLIFRPSPSSLPHEPRRHSPPVRQLRPDEVSPPR
jgi:tetratricopeptide (TPR) repeat protein